MRDSADHLADHVGFLSFDELRLHRELLSHVPHDHGPALLLTEARDRFRVARDLTDDPLPRAMKERELALEGPRVMPAPKKIIPARVLIIAHEPTPSRDEFSLLIAEQSIGRRVGRQDLAARRQWVASLGPTT